MWWLVRTWIPIAVAVTGLSAMLYTATQQQYRQSLNDPQVQMAEDGAALLAAGGAPADVVPHAGRMLDAASSLAPWIAVYDSAGLPLESSATRSGKPLAPPIGALEAARSGSGKDTDRAFENRVTWQLETGVRHAIVVVWVPETRQYVVAGRNMRDVENREWKLEILVAGCWLATLLATLFASWLSARIAMFRDG